MPRLIEDRIENSSKENSSNITFISNAREDDNLINSVRPNVCTPYFWPPFPAFFLPYSPLNTKTYPFIFSNRRDRYSEPCCSPVKTKNGNFYS